MGDLIQVQPEVKPPTIICPHCQNEILIDLAPFNKDVSKILRDNCVRCGGEIHVGTLILSHRDLKGLLSCIQIVVSSLNAGNVLLK